MIIYVNKDDMRSYGFSHELWEGRTIQVFVPNDFIGGNKTYNQETDEWIDDPVLEPQEEHLIMFYNQEKEALLNKAHNKISIWQSKLSLGIISDKDKASLIEWLEYIDSLDSTSYPDALPTK